MASAGDDAGAAAEAAAEASAGDDAWAAAPTPSWSPREETDGGRWTVARQQEMAARELEIAARLAKIDEELQKPLVDPAVRQEEIEARLAQIDEQLKGSQL